jgi:hypothetical protein
LQKVIENSNSNHGFHLKFVIRTMWWEPSICPRTHPQLSALFNRKHVDKAKTNFVWLTDNKHCRYWCRIVSYSWQKLVQDIHKEEGMWWFERKIVKSLSSMHFFFWIKFKEKNLENIKCFIPPCWNKFTTYSTWCESEINVSRIFSTHTPPNVV